MLSFVARVALLAMLPARAAAGDISRNVALSASVDRVIIRGALVASVAVGPPHLTIVVRNGRGPTVDVAHDGSLVTLVESAALPHDARPRIRVTVARLRGLATSGAVALSIIDPKGPPLFLDLSGSTVARARGSVPMLRITTSGTARIDLTAFVAATARAHARQSSRLAIRVTHRLTVVAVDDARVTYTGTTHLEVARKSRATVTPATP